MNIPYERASKNILPPDIEEKAVPFKYLFYTLVVVIGGYLLKRGSEYLYSLL